MSVTEQILQFPPPSEPTTPATPNAPTNPNPLPENPAVTPSEDDGEGIFIMQNRHGSRYEEGQY